MGMRKGGGEEEEEEEEEEESKMQVNSEAAIRSRSLNDCMDRCEASWGKTPRRIPENPGNQADEGEGSVASFPTVFQFSELVLGGGGRGRRDGVIVNWEQLEDWSTLYGQKEEWLFIWRLIWPSESALLISSFPIDFHSKFLPFSTDFQLRFSDPQQAIKEEEEEEEGRTSSKEKRGENQKKVRNEAKWNKEGRKEGRKGERERGRKNPS